MATRRFLLIYITTHSGHHRASAAIEHTLLRLDPHASVVAVDGFQYVSPLVRWAISRSYFSLIRHQPDVWEYLYDNPVVHRRVQHLRALLHRYQAGKLQRLLETVRPDVIACTQAYPCGIVADFKKHHHLSIPVVGILTDYAPHLYWFHDTVDLYVVPSEQVKQRFVISGVADHRVRVTGIPIDPRFLERHEPEVVARQFDLTLDQPIILIMGGGAGFGRIREIVLNLDGLPSRCQLVVLTGTNRPLMTWVQSQRFRHRVVPLSYTDEVHKLMEIATVLVSKPGGLTTSEALAKHLPLIIVNPIPGQEAYNARFLLSQGAAVQAWSPEAVRQTVRDLLDNPEQLQALRRRNAELSHPNAAFDIAKLLIELADRPQTGHPTPPVDPGPIHLREADRQ